MDSTGVEGFIDEPEPIAKAKFEIKIIEAIEKHEPRVKVSYIKWQEVSEDGKISPVIGLEVIDGLA